MSSAITTLAATPNAALTITETRRSAQQMIAQRAAIVECMSSVMRKDHDYGTIPGTPKPNLYKPGSEKILNLFHLAAKPEVEDLSTPDCIRYRVTITVIHAPTGTVSGFGVGEASSAESKYQWRAAVCDEEWEDTPDDRKRTKWKKGERGAYSIRQVRADMEDIANTVLKMAKKRAQIDAVLTTTAASDIFAQDVEELVAAGLDLPPESTELPPSTPLPQELQRKADAPPPQQKPAAEKTSAATIDERQGRIFWAKAMERVKDFKLIMEYLKSVHGVAKKDLILASRYQEAIKWAETGEVD